MAANGTTLAVAGRMIRRCSLAGLIALALLALSTNAIHAQTIEGSKNQDGTLTAGSEASTDAPESTSHDVRTLRGDAQNEPKEPKRRRHWYGGAILLVDSAALALGIAAATTSSAPLGIGAGAAYFAGGPIVHAAHDTPGAALGSLGLRVGIPIVAAGVGAGVAVIAEGECSDEWCGLSAAIGGVLGFGAGMLVASIVDIAGFAYELEPNPSTLRVALAPRVDPKQGAAGVDLVGLW